MKPSAPAPPARATVSLLLLAGVFAMQSACANDPPAAPAWLAEFSIVPLALLFFSWSGAARLYDESRGKGGGRVAMLVLSLLVTLISGIHEGLAALSAPLLCAYAGILGARMIDVSSRAPKNSYARRASRWGGVLLIPTVVFLASFSWIFVGDYASYADRREYEALLKFRDYQRDFAGQHQGKYQELRQDDASRAENDHGDFGRQWWDSGMRYLSSSYPSDTSTKIDVSYGADMKSYQIKIRPLAFIPWPYRLFAPRRAYFMAEDGVIHFERSWSSSTEATAASPRL